MSDEGFLSRWSRRKRAVATPPPPVAPDPREAAAPPGPALPGPAQADPSLPAGAEPAFDPASLPPVESLTAGNDFAAFLRDGVPAALRNAALRRAWSLDPAIRDFIGPADFAWDFNAPGGGMPGFSLDLPRDVERLLAQAIGLDTSTPEDEEEEQEPEVPSLAPDAGGAAPPLPDPAPAEDAAPGAPLRLEADAPLAGPVADAPPTLAVEAAEPSPPPRRRHGGAVPT